MRQINHHAAQHSNRGHAAGNCSAGGSYFDGAGHDQVFVVAQADRGIGW